jgi:hypothetical protein
MINEDDEEKKENIIKKFNNDIKIFCFKKNINNNNNENKENIIFANYSNKLIKSAINKTFYKIQLNLKQEISKEIIIKEGNYYKSINDSIILLFFQKTKS